MTAKDTKLELIVGVFVLVGILALTYLAVKLGKLEVISSRQNHVTAVFDSVAGLKTGAPIEVAGVQVGQVKRIALDGEYAVVTLALQPHVKVYQDAIAAIKTRGLIGDKYVSLSPGSDKELAPGGKIRDTESGVDLEAIIGEFIHGSAGSGSNGNSEKTKPEVTNKSTK
jgi:phospholipid/cholesterol/gamma-HCH transport system substrate-binding protein